MFELDSFLEDCRVALDDAQPVGAVKEVVGRAVRAGADTLCALSPERAGIFPIHLADDLSVFNVVWAPRMRIPPHNHLMWAVIGLYAGREDNHFFRRAQRGLASAGGRQLESGEVATLGHNAIHAVTNPLGRYTGALHVYGGNLTTCRGRSEWDPETLEESCFDFATTTRYFDEANRANAHGEADGANPSA